MKAVCLSQLKSKLDAQNIGVSDQRLGHDSNRSLQIAYVNIRDVVINRSELSLHTSALVGLDCQLLILH